MSKLLLEDCEKGLAIAHKKIKRLEAEIKRLRGVNL